LVRRREQGRGKRRRELAAGDDCGEAEGTGVLTTTRCTHGCLEFGFYRLVPTTVTCTADGAEVAAKLR
jgi:hypothetical protein